MSWAALIKPDDVNSGTSVNPFRSYVLPGSAPEKEKKKPRMHHLELLNSPVVRNANSAGISPAVVGRFLTQVPFSKVHMGSRFRSRGGALHDRDAAE